MVKITIIDFIARVWNVVVLIVPIRNFACTCAIFHIATINTVSIEDTDGAKLASSADTILVPTEAWV